MNQTKRIFVYGFAVFAAFFGAGNLILPPYLGFKSGPDWWLSALGFFFTATIIPLGALMAYSRLQGTMLDFGNKVSRRFSLVLCVLVYLIALLLPCPRTAAVTHEMAVVPFRGPCWKILNTIVSHQCGIGTPSRILHKHRFQLVWDIFARVDNSASFSIHNP